MRSGRELAHANFAKICSWARERHNANDWADYVKRGKLNRSEIALECNFARSVVSQNPRVMRYIVRVERLLKKKGILSSEPTTKTTKTASTEALDNQIVSINTKTQQRLRELESENAVLRAEVRGLREKLKRYQLIDEHLSETGRMIQP